MISGLGANGTFMSSSSLNLPCSVSSALSKSSRAFCVFAAPAICTASLAHGDTKVRLAASFANLKGSFHV